MKIFQLTASSMVGCEVMCRVSKKVFATREEANAGIPQFLDCCAISGMVADTAEIVELTFDFWVETLITKLLQPKLLDEIADDIEARYPFSSALLSIKAKDERRFLQIMEGNSEKKSEEQQEPIDAKECIKV